MSGPRLSTHLTKNLRRCVIRVDLFRVLALDIALGLSGNSTHSTGSYHEVLQSLCRRPGACRSPCGVGRPTVRLRSRDSDDHCRDGERERPGSSGWWVSHGLPNRDPVCLAVDGRPEQLRRMATQDEPSAQLGHHGYLAGWWNRDLSGDWGNDAEARLP